QVPTVVYGRVEDASTREPVAGARVFAPDSSSAVLTDSLGVFGIQIDPADPLAVNVERYGYVAQHFDLPAEAASSLNILLIEPQPVVLSGVNVVAETAIEKVLDK